MDREAEASQPIVGRPEHSPARPRPAWQFRAFY